MSLCGPALSSLLNFKKQIEYFLTKIARFNLLHLTDEISKLHQLGVVILFKGVGTIVHVNFWIWKKVITILKAICLVCLIIWVRLMLLIASSILFQYQFFCWMFWQHSFVPLVIASAEKFQICFLVFVKQLEKCNGHDADWQTFPLGGIYYQIFRLANYLLKTSDCKTFLLLFV